MKTINKKSNSLAKKTNTRYKMKQSKHINSEIALASSVRLLQRLLDSIFSFKFSQDSSVWIHIVTSQRY